MHAVWCLSLLTALSVAGAALATEPGTLSFPPPPSAADEAVVGLFHTLPSLACDTRSPMIGGRRGYFFQEHVSTPRVFVAGGNGTCASPVEDPVEQALRASKTNKDPYYHRGSGTPAARQAAHRRLLDMRSRPPTRQGVVEDVVHTPLGADMDQDAGLHYEQMVHRLLALHRNSFFGGVLRFTGEFDAIAVSRVTGAACLLQDCADMSALAIVEHSRRDLNSSLLPVLTFPLQFGQGLNQSDAPRRTLSITDDGLLSLGRAVMADPRWLQRVAPWRNTVKAHVGLTVKASARRREENNLDVFGNYNRWAIDDRDESWAGSPFGEETGSSKWLKAVAFVFCEPPMRSFVRHADRLCTGSESAAVKLAPLRPRINGRGQMPLEQPITVAGRQALWHLYANESDPTLLPCVPDDNVRHITPTGRDSVVELPPWLWGVGSREINPNSSSEVAVASAIRACVVTPPLAGVNASTEHVVHRMLERVHESGAHKTRSFDNLMASLQALSQSYDRTVFAAEPPEPPVTNSELLLAVIVVAPELVALVVLLASTSKWGRRELLVLLFVFLAGLVSMAAAVQQVVREFTGADWRGATLRDELSLDLVGSSGEDGAQPTRTVQRDLRGHLLFRSYSLIMVSRLGYRRALVALVAGGMALIYMLVSLVVVYCVWRLWRQRQPGKLQETGLGDTDGVAELGAVEGGPRAVAMDARASLSRGIRRTSACGGGPTAG